MMLNTKKFALAAGIFWSAFMFIFTIISAGTGYAFDFMHLFVQIYPGYDVTYMGSILGLVYGFFDGFIGCYIFAWLYNKLQK